MAQIPSDELDKLKGLLASGLLSEAEFQAAVGRLQSASVDPAPSTPPPSTPPPSSAPANPVYHAPAAPPRARSAPAAAPSPGASTAMYKVAIGVLSVMLLISWVSCAGAMSSSSAAKREARNARNEIDTARSERDAARSERDTANGRVASLQSQVSQKDSELNRLRGVAEVRGSQLDRYKQAVQDVRWSTRRSLMSESTKVLVLSNPSAVSVDFQLKCFTTSGSTKTISVSIERGGSTEVGDLQGWSGNWVTGERAEAWYQGEHLWSIRIN